MSSSFSIDGSTLIDFVTPPLMFLLFLLEMTGRIKFYTCTSVRYYH